MDTNNNLNTPEQVASNLKRFLRQKGTLQDAATLLGVGPTTLSNQLSGKNYFTRKTANRYAAAFGVNADYLVTGAGELVPNFDVPKNLFPIAPEAKTLEERIGKSVIAQVRKLNELARTYNSLAEHIRETADYIEKGSEWYEICQEAIKKLDGVEIEPVLLFGDAIKDINLM